MKSKRYLQIAMIVVVVLVYTTAYAYEQYDPVKFKNTKGYNPDFLKDPVVLQTCQDSHHDLQRVGLPDLGYCSKELGTL